MTSASTIADAFVTTLQAASAFGSSGADTDFAVLERSSGSCVVVEVGDVRGIPEAFGNPSPKEYSWTFRFLVYSKDLGNAHQTRRRVLACWDTFLNAISNDDTVLGTVDRIIEIRGSKSEPPEDMVEMGSTTFIQSTFEVDVEKEVWP
jgi:hypothetical protein